MIPFGVHCATLSLISHDKVKGFVDDIGHPEWGVELTQHRRNRSATGLADEIWGILDGIDRNRRQTYRQVREAQDRLLARTERNFLHFGQRLLPRANELLASQGRTGCTVAPAATSVRSTPF